MKAVQTVLLAVVGALAVDAAIAADTQNLPPASLLEAIVAGKPMTNFRLRYEYVNQDGVAAGSTTRNLDEAQAWTLRSLIGWQTASFRNFSIGVQLINVTQLNDDFYDTTDQIFGNRLATPGAIPVDKRKYPAVVDPDYTGINQLYLDWTGLPDTKVRFGRQSVKLDNVRFIGNVEFRQLMQVFDGVAVENRSIPQVELYVAHFEALRRITGQYFSDGNVDILHAAWKFAPMASLTGYGYLQNMPNNGFNPYASDTNRNVRGGTGFTDNSSQTWGLRADGAHKLSDDWKVLYTAEYADQNHYRGGNRNIDAHYWRLGAGAGYRDWFVRLDHETLSSNGEPLRANRYAFQTPLATGHLFQGMADQFLLTPPEGMEDTFLTLGGKLFGVQLLAEYHWFHSDRDFRTTGDSNVFNRFTGDNYGEEFDLVASYAYDQHWSGKLEYFNFREGDCYTTTGACLDNTASRKRDKEMFLFTLMYTF
jgi:hypothetical protein